MFSKGPWCKNINCQVSAFTCFKTLMFCTILWLTLGLFQPAIQIHGWISYVQPFWWVSTEALLRENSCWIIWNYFVLKQPISPMFSVAEIVQYLLEFSESWSFNPHVSADDKINNARHCIVIDYGILSMWELSCIHKQGNDKLCKLPTTVSPNAMREWHVGLFIYISWWIIYVLVQDLWIIHNLGNILIYALVIWHQLWCCFSVGRLSRFVRKCLM